MPTAIQFDPALKQLLLQTTGSPLGEAVSEEVSAREVPVVAKLVDPAAEVEGLNIVSRFTNIVTGRVRLDRLVALRQHPNIASLKASTIVSVALAFSVPEIRASADLLRAEFPPAGVTGRGVIIAFLDWGCDFAHANLRDPEGRTRLLCLWDQRGGSQVDSPTPFGYGRLFHREQINAALAQSDPYAALGYDPLQADDGTGTHCTHVMDIAAGNGSAPGSAPGVAPEADLICVHLMGDDTQPEDTLADSVRVLEALRFIMDYAAGRPLVINCSLGKTGGPHDATPLVTQALDSMLEETPGCAVVMSAGNYFSAHIHSSGQLHSGETADLRWHVPATSQEMAEMEVWYPGSDRFSVELSDPLGNSLGRVELGEDHVVRQGDRIIASIFHRRHDPGNGDHQIDIFVWPDAPSGRWITRLYGEEVKDGHYHAWIERARPKAQARFEPESATPTNTTGTICNGSKTIAVGAYDARLPSFPLGLFSSAGPTRDGRDLPVVSAPGVGIRAARSSYLTLDGRVMNALTEKSGTSMAAPHVSGVVALMFEAAGDTRLTAEQTREILITTARVEPADSQYRRYGAGRVDAVAAIKQVRPLTQSGAQLTVPPPEEFAMDTVSPLVHTENELTEPELPVLEVHDETYAEYESMNQFEQPDVYSGLNETYEAAQELYAEAETLHPLQHKLEPILPQLMVEQGDIELRRLDESGEPRYSKRQPLWFAPGGQSYVSGPGRFHYHAADFIYNTAYSLGYDVPVYPIHTPIPSEGQAYLNLAATFKTLSEGDGDLRTYLDRFFEVVAQPGDSSAPALRTGDLLLRGPQPGADYGHLAVIVDPRLRDVQDPFFYDRDETEGLGLHCISAGLAIHDSSARYGRALTDWQGKLLNNRMVVRLKASAINPSRIAGRLNQDPDYESRIARAYWVHTLRDEVHFEHHEALDEEGPTIAAGTLRVEHVPLVSPKHKGKGPDLYLFWNDKVGKDTVNIDVVVHLHGFGTCGERKPGEKPEDLPILDRLVAAGRLPFSDPSGPKKIVDRDRPTIAILPRGSYFPACHKDTDGKPDCNLGYDAGYDFPILNDESGLSSLIEVSLRCFEAEQGIPQGQLKQDRLILAAHSGGGKALLKLLQHHKLNDPDEIHIFDALYQFAGTSLEFLLGWLHRHVTGRQMSALRIFYRGGTAPRSQEMKKAIHSELPSASSSSDWYRVEKTTVEHCDLPQSYGWRLLKNPSADVPNISKDEEGK